MIRKLAVLAFLCGCCVSTCFGQTSTQQMPPDYGGVSTRVAGLFVTPIAGAPFSATVDIISKHVLPDGSSVIRKTMNHVARDSSGRIYNERRLLVPSAYKGDPALLSAHIYDPASRMSTYLEPMTHLARQILLPQRPVTPNGLEPGLGPHGKGKLTQQLDLGEQTVGTTKLHGTRKVWTVQAENSGTGKEVQIVDDYWYSPELSVYLILKHEDPRTGEQIVAVRDVNRSEPDPKTFEVPNGYKVLDETPVR